MSRELISSGAKWESEVGYSRAVRTGDQVYVSGTSSVDNRGRVVAPGDAAAQTRRIYRIAIRACVPRHPHTCTYHLSATEQQLLR